MENSEAIWNQRYLDGDTPWDKGTYTPALLEVFIKQLIPTGAEVLVPGCGLGHDALAIADMGYSVTGIDISDAAIKGARRIHEGAEGLKFIQADLFDEVLPQQKRYDAIWEHTCYCAISPNQRADYVQTIDDLLVGNGLFIGLFFTNTQLPPGEGPPFETSAEDVNRMFSDRFELLWEKEPDATFPARVGCEWLMAWRKKS